RDCLRLIQIAQARKHQSIGLRGHHEGGALNADVAQNTNDLFRFGPLEGELVDDHQLAVGRLARERRADGQALHLLRERLSIAALYRSEHRATTYVVRCADAPLARPSRVFLAPYLLGASLYFAARLCPRCAGALVVAS